MTTDSGPVRPAPVEDDLSDVLIVGYGPVGQVLANLLALRGWRVRVVERWPRPYPMPRAVAFDSEGARILATAGVAEIIGEIGESSSEYVFENADGQRLLEIEVGDQGWCGWPDSTSMYQPALEEALAAYGDTLPTLHVLRGWQAIRIEQDSDEVRLSAAGAGGGERRLRARWAVGCDGANSFMRSQIGSSVTDLGFSQDWLICDVALDQPHRFRPNNLQICDPARPRTAVSAGPGHRRWEFMRVAGETVEGLNSKEQAWQLLKLFDVNPGQATLERFHVYTFQSSYADQWRSGRLLLAGDAAHVMPPFAGQGMCSGFRDAANLAWKLDLVLREVAGEELLDSYDAERRAHVQHAIGMSVNLGRVICQTDPSAAADRDMVMLAARERPATGARQASPVHPLSSGLLLRDPEGRPRLPAGVLAPQGRVARGRESGWFDDLVGRGFALLTTVDPEQMCDAESRTVLTRLGARVVRVLPPDTPPERAGGHEVVDVDGLYHTYLGRARAIALLIRPDFYIFGGAADQPELANLLRELHRQLVISS
jgi:flavoprotein hydroxylase